MRDRYGIDVNDAQPDRDALEGALNERQAADEQRRRTEQARKGLETGAVLAATERDPEAEREVDRQRNELAEALAGVDDHEVVEARMLADVYQGRPAREAATTPLQTASKSRRTRGTGARVRQSQRTPGRCGGRLTE